MAEHTFLKTPFNVYNRKLVENLSWSFVFAAFHVVFTVYACLLGRWNDLWSSLEEIELTMKLSKLFHRRFRRVCFLLVAVVIVPV